MNSRDVVGRRIVSVRQTRWWNPCVTKFQMVIDAIVLDDGTEITFRACEAPDEPVPLASVQKSDGATKDP